MFVLSHLSRFLVKNMWLDRTTMLVCKYHHQRSSSISLMSQWWRQCVFLLINASPSINILKLGLTFNFFMYVWWPRYPSSMFFRSCEGASEGLSSALIITVFVMIRSHYHTSVHSWDSMINVIGTDSSRALIPMRHFETQSAVRLRS